MNENPQNLEDLTILELITIHTYFNNKFKNYLDENTWNRTSRSYKKPEKALQEMTEFKEELSNDYSRLESRITNLVSK
jgi:hypothetical protein